MKAQKLTVVGAGPGDEELITLKGVRALQEADVVLYDALVNPALLQYAPASVPKIYVGKREGQHSYTQQQINEMIVAMAGQYGHVVRLKGGDPFVFGRGHEELEAARSNNIIAQYVPGISSSISVAGLADIPVTQRGYSESFWVITGTTAKGELSKDVALAAQTNATVVILMGLKKLPAIAEVFQLAGKQSLPVAVIQNGSLPDQQLVLGSMTNIVERVAERKISSPAIIVAGEVVRLHPSHWQKEVNTLLATR